MRPTDEDIFYRIHGKESDKECRPCQSGEFADKIDLPVKQGCSTIPKASKKAAFLPPV